MTGTILLPVLVFFPMAGALMSYLIGRRNKNLRNLFAVLVTAAEFAMMIRVLKKIFWRWCHFASIFT